MKNLTINFSWKRVSKNNFPLQLHIKIINRTQKTAFVTGMYFVPQKLRADPNAIIDNNTGKMELKFPIQREGESFLRYLEFDGVIKNDETNNTFACIDPDLSDNEIEKALHFKKAGHLHFYLTLLDRDKKPTVYKFKVPAHIKYNYTWVDRFKYLLRIKEI